ncbi:TPA: hypothetical protein DCW38_07585 [candidate division WOR-3 bacterium]|uniref:POTRA domain-containing protein n=1 Tax=candidate division WOR-3 bacterium TaxID=2052148 RepID=A0A350HBV5_UNCW3|nr:hypothetical protein [candidate division WOR-3 bacterium]
MKLRYYSNKGDRLYRHYTLQKKKKKNFMNKLPQATLRIMLLILIVSLSAFAINYFLKTGSMFAVKTIKIVVANEKSSVEQNSLDAFKGVNLNTLKKSDIAEFYNNKNSEYGVRSIQKILPSALKVILYRRFPIFLVNNEWVVNNDLSIFPYTEKCVNYIPLTVNESELKSIFDIPGLPTIHKQIIKERDLIRSMAFEGSNIYLRMKNGKLIVISAGQSLPSLKDASASDFKVLDFRFNNAIYVKK